MRDYEIWFQETRDMTLCSAYMYYICLLNHLGVNHKCDRETDGHVAFGNSTLA